MPILDFRADHSWFLMPWAPASAAQRQELLQKPNCAPWSTLFDDCWTFAS
ncbi:hypothetical protein [Streptomyces sp. NPDC014006]